MRPSTQRGLTTSIVLVVVGAVLLFAGTIALYAREEVIDREAFADRAVAALDDDGVRHLVSREIVVNLVDRGSTDLVAARPLLESVVGARRPDAALPQRLPRAPPWRRTRSSSSASATRRS